MIQISSILTSLALLSVILISNVKSAEVLNAEQRNSEVMALTRDGFYRENPDELLQGFFAAWPVVLYIIGITFFGVAIIAFLGYITGICKGRNIEFHSII